ncbi:hypothetical protein [Cellulophaga sp. E16_2]|nr:hypothetical protein [Cellulophaga sp. E16_2]
MLKKKIAPAKTTLAEEEEEEEEEKEIVVFLFELNCTNMVEFKRN